MSPEIMRFVAIRFVFGWAVWDQDKARVVDGIYDKKEDCFSMAIYFNAYPKEGDRDWYPDGTHFHGRLYYE